MISDEAKYSIQFSIETRYHRSWDLPGVGEPTSSSSNYWCRLRRSFLCWWVSFLSDFVIKLFLGFILCVEKPSAVQEDKVPRTIT